MKEERHDTPRPSEGNTVMSQGENQAPKARMPHERDESADSQSADAANVRRIGQIAHDDVVEGQPDTDKGPALDAAYERQKDGEEKKRRQ
ncbi:MAG TPA: hypothetical protein VEB23_04335 [Ramlibacter sp.]|nr:hypothetical protein [Ramlibacter sp.]